MIYGYARVSTRGQDKYGNSLDDQIKRLTDRGCVRVFHDSCTGTKMDRPAFNELIGLLRSGDTLMVTKLDRFARTAADGAKVIRGLVERGVIVDVLNMGRADNTSMGKLMVTILLAFAEFERDCIVERTSAGKAVAKATKPDWKEGRRKKEIPECVVSEYREKIKKGDMSVTECCKEMGISRSLWYDRLKNAG